MSLVNRRRNLFMRAAAILYFQKYPGTDRRAGIEGLEWVLRVEGAEVQTGTTAADGRVTLNFDRTKTGNLEIMGMTFDITVRANLEASNTDAGVQRRLNMLGYNAGAVDGNHDTVGCDRAILNFQADTHRLRMDGIVGPITQPKIRRAVGE